MKYFLDTEFIERPNTIDLISIGIVCEDGREYYAISNEYYYSDASEWVKNNVITPMYIKTVNGDNRNRFDIQNFQQYYGKSIEKIKNEILKFIDNDKPEFWGYYADYDWVIFCWIFGRMIDLPEGWPMYCKDLKQSLDESGNNSIPNPENEHNALEDAKWNKRLHRHIYGKSE